ncbi:MAG TPA: helix-turn-helix transcriptional regulator [Candidatus Angelobacter sp.]|nr:helix-turn-helix transcriptional regulator [Candidatus Angelobacter sp.]
MPSALDLFGKQIRVMRKERRLSQEKLAELCAVHRNYIGRVERAETNIRFDSVIRLSAGLKVRPDKLFKLISRPTIADADAIKKKTSEE